MWARNITTAPWAFDVGDKHPHGYALYFFTRRALQLLEE
jgi:hypothetical protein